MHTVRPDDLAIKRQNSAYRGANSGGLPRIRVRSFAQNANFVRPKLPLGAFHVTTGDAEHGEFFF